jgi:hypothetical protein
MNPSRRDASRAMVLGAAQDRDALGDQDGLRLTLGLDALRRLPQCFVPVPEVAIGK